MEIFRKNPKLSKSNSYQVLSEICMLTRFIVGADDAGLSTPGPTTLVLQDLSRIQKDLVEMLHDWQEWINDSRYNAFPGPCDSWPIPSAYQVMALARHAGIPTRLLDWSTSPHIAAYFACEKAAKKQPGTT